MLDRATTLIPKMSVAIEILQQRVDKLAQNVRVFDQTNTHTHTHKTKTTAGEHVTSNHEQSQHKTGRDSRKDSIECEQQQTKETKEETTKERRGGDQLF